MMNFSFLGATRSAAGTELVYPRQKVVATAKYFKAQAIDMVHIDYKDLKSLEKYSLEGAAMGFTGERHISSDTLMPSSITSLDCAITT